METGETEGDEKEKKTEEEGSVLSKELALRIVVCCFVVYIQYICWRWGLEVVLLGCACVCKDVWRGCANCPSSACVSNLPERVAKLII